MDGERKIWNQPHRPKWSLVELVKTKRSWDGGSWCYRTAVVQMPQQSYSDTPKHSYTECLLDKTFKINRENFSWHEMVVLWFRVFARWLQTRSISSSESYSSLLVIPKGKKTAVFKPLEAMCWDLPSGLNLESLVLTSITFMSDVKMLCCIAIKSKNTSSRHTSY